MKILTLYAYTRVSTTKQGKKGYSLEAQKELIKNYIQTKKLQPKKIIWVEEVASGKNLNRPKLNKILENKKDTDFLIVAKADRLSRSVENAWQIEQSFNNQIIYLDIPTEQFEPSIRKLLLGMFFSIAERERELISMRTKIGLKKAKEKGKKWGITKDQIKKDPELKKRLFKNVKKMNEKRKQLYKEKVENTGTYLLAVKLNNKKITKKELINKVNKTGFTTLKGKKYTNKTINYLEQRTNNQLILKSFNQGGIKC